MKLIYLLPLCCITCFNCTAQIFDTIPHIIDLNANSVRSLDVADLDGDGDIDVLSASFILNEIGWYENLDGEGSFSAQFHTITANVYGVVRVMAADIDGDGDSDILSSSIYDRKAAWYKNLDGHGNFGGERLIDTLYGGGSVQIADIDSDGDLDISILDSYTHKLLWYKNIVGFGTFGNGQVIEPCCLWGTNRAVDMDGDGDLDIIYSNQPPDNDNYQVFIKWSENSNGLGNFESEHLVLSEWFSDISGFEVADIDGDGSTDVIFGSENRLRLYRNHNGHGDYHPTETIDDSNTASTLIGVITAGDTDLDGDVDLIVSYKSILQDGRGKIVLYENADGMGNFEIAQVIDLGTDKATEGHQIDMDGDGDLDLLVVLNYPDSKILWYENRVNSVGISSMPTNNIMVYPNPAQEWISIESSVSNTISIVNILGETILNRSITKGRNRIDISILSPGVYFLQTQSGGRKKFVKL